MKKDLIFIAAKLGMTPIANSPDKPRKFIDDCVRDNPATTIADAVPQKAKTRHSTLKEKLLALTGTQRLLCTTLKSSFMDPLKGKAKNTHVGGINLNAT